MISRVPVEQAYKSVKYLTLLDPQAVREVS